MIEIGLKIRKKPNLKLTTKSRKMWRGIAIEAQKVIVKRTLSGRDIENKPFDAYSEDYGERKTKGKVSKPGGGYYGARSAKVNLSLSSRMLNSIARRVTESNAFLVLSGQQGFKAFVNELKGRVFFDISKKQAVNIVKRVADDISKKNNLKKR